MKNTFIFCLVLSVSFAFANELCNTNNEPGIPQGTCTQIGYVCNLGFDVVDGANIMYFALGADTSCSTLLTSSQKTYIYPGSSTYSPMLKVFLIEDEYGASPLSLALVGSLALSTSNNKELVSIIYKKVHEIEYGGIRLISISKVN